MEVGERPWGKYYVLDEGQGYKVKRIEVLPHKRLSLQSHEHRFESWHVVSGVGTFTRGDEISTWRASYSMTCYINPKMKHRIANDTDELLVVIEIQQGSSMAEEDIVRYEDDFGRAPDGK